MIKNLNLTFFFFLVAISSKATTFTFSGNSTTYWDQVSAWTPSYPGTTIAVGDVVNITAGNYGRIPAGVSITNNGTINFTGSNSRMITAAGTFFLNNGNLNIGNYQFDNNGTFYNNGIVTCNGYFENIGAVINNNITGVFNLGNQFSMAEIANDGNGLTNNIGTFNSSGNITGPGLFNNTGIFNANPGNSTADFGGASTGTVNATTAGTLLTFYANTTNLTNQTINLSFASASVYSKMDMLWSSTNTLGGPLNITLSGGYTPVSGTNFTILTGSYSGTFSTINFPAAPIGLQWSITYNPNSVVVTLGVPSLALPLTWHSFDAKLMSNKTVELNWSTLNEENTSHFIVEKSKDGIQWNAIAKVDKIQNRQNALSNYQSLDVNLHQGMNYYRIQQVDLDGQFTYSAIKNILNIHSEIKVNLYPNPSSKEIHLVIDGVNSPLTLEIYSALGAKIREIKSISTHEIVDISSFQMGNYFVKIYSNNNEPSTFQFMKN